MFSVSDHIRFSDSFTDGWKFLPFCHLCVQLLVTQSCPTLCDPMDLACQAPLFMGIFRQECWSGLPFSSSRGIFLTQGSNLCLLCLLHYGQIICFLILEYAAVETVFFFFFFMFPNIHSCVSHSVIVVSDSLWPHGLQLTRLLCPWSFPGKDAGVGCHFLLQGILPTLGSHHISCTSRWALYCWITREAHLFIYLPLKQVYCRLTEVFQDWKFLWVCNHNILRKFRTVESMH